MRIAVVVVAVTALLPACGGGDTPSAPLPRAAAELTLESPAFDDGGTVPRRYTCDGAGVSPPLSWSGVPRAARELALVVEDPDADRFVHWTVLRIPPRATGVGEGAVPHGAVETVNSFGDRRWGGPCPPEGKAPHRYVFALYALREPLDLGKSASPDEVRDALSEQALARGLLTARYGRG